MRSSKQYENWKEIWLKFGSNLVSEKTWIFTVATIALFSGIISQVVWVSIIGGLYSIGKLMKVQWLKTLTGQNTE